ncbi:MAG TPA: site-2 protease family protein [Pseudobacteroides sp.]|uniref:site-2 protease family protein n=1 Tax=Pseudobacteroides sp. TaxID=1968840 RepID=UPI002F920C97
MFDRTVQQMIMSIPGILIALVTSGFAQAYMADKLGDRTPRYEGRLTINPKAHVDPIGFIIFVLIGFGWSKPVNINPRNFKNMRIDDSLVSAAGFIGNLLMAVLFALIIKVFLIFNVFNALGNNVGLNLIQILDYGIQYNVVFFILGILPIPPFPGSRILENLTDIERFEIYANIKRYSFIIFMLLVVTNILGKIISPPIVYIYSTILQIFNIK